MAVDPKQYMRGTPAFNATAAKFGEAAALAQWQAAIDAEHNQTPLETSTWSIFGKQIVTDPLAAPLEGANRTLGNTFVSFLKSPWVMLAIGLIIFGAMGGFGWLGRKVFSK